MLIDGGALADTVLRSRFIGGIDRRGTALALELLCEELVLFRLLIVGE